MMQPLLGGFDPGFKPVAFPALRPDQHHPGRLYEQDAQVTIAALGYLAEDGAVSGRDLPRHQPEPGSEIAALGEHLAIADRRHHGARDDWSDARQASMPIRHGGMFAIRASTWPRDHFCRSTIVGRTRRRGPISCQYQCPSWQWSRLICWTWRCSV